MNKLIILCLVAFIGCSSVTDPPQSVPVDGKWFTSDKEYQMTIAGDTAYMYEKFDGQGAHDSSFDKTSSTVHVSFVFPGTTAHYTLNLSSDSLFGTAMYGPVGSKTFPIVFIRQ